MPTYEYACPEGHDFERFQKMTDKPRAKCPACGRMATRKISGGAGLHFKGSGFYITDYGKDGKGPRKDASEKTEKMEKPAEKMERTEKAEKTEKMERTEKTAERPEKAPAAEKAAPAKAERPAPGKAKAE